MISQCHTLQYQKSHTFKCIKDNIWWCVLLLSNNPRWGCVIQLNAKSYCYQPEVVDYFPLTAHPEVFYYLIPQYLPTSVFFKKNLILNDMSCFLTFNQLHLILWNLCKTLVHVIIYAIVAINSGSLNCLLCSLSWYRETASTKSSVMNITDCYKLSL